ncbi:hypothetical protein RFI_09476, partial [Reticulomyxa filosa]
HKKKKKKKKKICVLCKEKRGDLCPNMMEFGHGKGTSQGGCCEYFVVKELYCYRLRTNISWNEAALLAPLGVAHNAIEQLGQSPELLVTGCGTIGLFVVSVAKNFGFRRVIAADVLSWRLEIAKKMGADVTIDCKEQDLKSIVMKLTDGNGIEALIECSGTSEYINVAFGLLRKGGRIFCEKEEVQRGKNQKQKKKGGFFFFFCAFDGKDVISKSLQLLTAHSRRIFDTWKEAEKLVAKGKVQTSLLLSHCLPLKEWRKGFEALSTGATCKVLFDPSL